MISILHCTLKRSRLMPGIRQCRFRLTAGGDKGRNLLHHVAADNGDALFRAVVMEDEEPGNIGHRGREHIRAKVGPWDGANCGFECLKDVGVGGYCLVYGADSSLDLVAVDSHYPISRLA